jgi:hypothetical protein
MGSLFEVGESTSAPVPAEERIAVMVEPLRLTRAVSPPPLADDEEEVQSGDSSNESAAGPDEVFMPPGDMAAPRRMAVAYVDNLPPFFSLGPLSRK